MRPPAPRPNAATPCSRPPSRRCAGSVSVPGASARSPPPPSFCCTTSTAAPHDQQASGAVTGNGSLDLYRIVAALEIFQAHLGTLVLVPAEPLSDEDFRDLMVVA